MTDKIFARLKRLLPGVLRKKLPRRVRIVEIDEVRSRALNLRYRKKRKPAKVLSFRYGPDYGEILVCPAVIRREAQMSGNAYKYQLTWMVLHGMIHLAGLHHEKSAPSSQKSVQVEQRMLKKLFRH